MNEKALSRKHFGYGRTMKFDTDRMYAKKGIRLNVGKSKLQLSRKSQFKTIDGRNRII